MSRSKNLAMMFLLGALLVGAALGFSAERVFGDRAGEHMQTRAEMREQLAQRMALTAAQRAQLDSILDRRHQEMSAVLAPVRSQLQAIRDHARGEIVKMLNESQRKSFDDILREQAEQQHQDSIAAAAARR